MMNQPPEISPFFNPRVDRPFYDRSICRDLLFKPDTLLIVFVDTPSVDGEDKNAGITRAEIAAANMTVAMVVIRIVMVFESSRENCLGT